MCTTHARSLLLYDPQDLELSTKQVNEVFEKACGGVPIIIEDRGGRVGSRRRFSCTITATSFYSIPCDLMVECHAQKKKEAANLARRAIVEQAAAAGIVCPEPVAVASPPLTPGVPASETSVIFEMTLEEFEEEEWDRRHLSMTEVEWQSVRAGEPSFGEAGSGIDLSVAVDWLRRMMGTPLCVRALPFLLAGHVASVEVYDKNADGEGRLTEAVMISWMAGEPRKEVWVSTANSRTACQECVCSFVVLAALARLPQSP